MSKIKKINVSCLLIAIMIIMVTACAKPPQGFARFLEGAPEAIQYGESILVEEYIEKVEDAEYELVAVDSEGKEISITGILWKPEKPGEYKLKYTVTLKKTIDTAEFALTVSVPKLFVSNNSPSTLVYEYGDEINFVSFISSLGFYVSSYYSYNLYVKEVEIDGVRTDVSDKAAYVINSYHDHLFIISCEAEDGQNKEISIKVGVRYIDPIAQSWMNDNNVTSIGYMNIKDDLTVTLPGAQLAGTGGNMTEFPYVAFNSNFTDNTFIELDFIGKGMPIVAFYLDEVTQSLTDGGKGLFLASGWPNGIGEESYWWNSRYTAYGPFKSSAPSYLDGGGRIWNSGDNSTFGFMSLNENTKYKLIVGTTNGVSWNGTTASITLHSRLINRDTSVMVGEYVITINHVPKWCDFSGTDNSYFNGKIAVYGLTNYDTVFKMNLPKSNIKSLNEITNLSEFIRAPQLRVGVNETLNVADYIVEPPSGVDYILTCKQEFGDAFTITGNTFVLPAEGKYVLTYHVRDGEAIKNTLTLTAINGFTPDSNDLFAKTPMVDGTFYSNIGGYAMRYSSLVHSSENNSTESLYFYGDNQGSGTAWPSATISLPGLNKDFTDKTISFDIKFGNLTHGNMGFNIIRENGEELVGTIRYWQYSKINLADGWINCVFPAAHFGENLTDIAKIKLVFDFEIREVTPAGLKEVWMDNLIIRTPDSIDEKLVPQKHAAITQSINFYSKYTLEDSNSSVKSVYTGTAGAVGYEDFLGIDGFVITGANGMALQNLLSIQAHANPSLAWQNAVLTYWIYNDNNFELYAAPKLKCGTVNIGSWNTQPWLYTICKPNSWTQVYIPLKDLGITSAFNFTAGDFNILLIKSANYQASTEYSFKYYIDGFDIVSYTDFAFPLLQPNGDDIGDLLSTMQLSDGAFYNSSYRRLEYDSSVFSPGSGNSTVSAKFSGSGTTRDAIGPLEQPNALLSFGSTQDLTGKSIKFDIKFDAGVSFNIYLKLKTADGTMINCNKLYWQMTKTDLGNGWYTVTLPVTEFSGNLTDIVGINVAFDFVRKGTYMAIEKTVWLDNLEIS